MPILEKINLINILCSDAWAGITAGSLYDDYEGMSPGFFEDTFFAIIISCVLASIYAFFMDYKYKEDFGENFRFGVLISLFTGLSYGVLFAIKAL